MIRAVSQIASAVALIAALLPNLAGGQDAQDAPIGVEKTSSLGEMQRIAWDFGRANDLDSNKQPDDWKRYRGIGYPMYVNVGIAPRDPELEQQLRALDTEVLHLWTRLRRSVPGIPLPPSIADAIVNRYLRVDLDGGQVKLESPPIAASGLYQYGFSCQIMTQGLRHTSALAELVFLDPQGKQLSAHRTSAVGGSTEWSTVHLGLVRPPQEAAEIRVRLIVQRGEDGLEDVRGVIGFDDIRIDQYPQLRITTDESLGVYALGQPVQTTVEVMGISAAASVVHFQLFNSEDEEIASQTVAAPRDGASPGAAAGGESAVASQVRWQLPALEPGFYRVSGTLTGQSGATLNTQTTLAVIDELVAGPPHGSFGWTLPDGGPAIPAKEMVAWLTSLGVAWVKQPCWLPPQDTARVDELASLLGRFQDAGIQTVGILDVPPDDQLQLYNLPARSDVVAAQLFRDEATWQPLLEPVMSRLSLKVRTWQLGADRDHSFLGRPRLQESIRRISTGLQGFGQPIEVAISWPWMEQELPDSEASWQAVCRSNDPPLSAGELSAFLELATAKSRQDGPETWLLLDPIPKDAYDRDSRILDLVLRMAAVRSHRVQAAFVSQPRDGQQGLLKANGRPDELLLPWRTTSRLIGNLSRGGSLQLRSGAENLVFTGSDRAVLMVWSAEPTEERIYLGEGVQAVDVWGKVSTLEVESAGDQVVQRIPIGPLPTFLVNVDPMLLAFGMSVQVEQTRLDSLLGKVQPLSISFTNPSPVSLSGQVRVLAPEGWNMSTPARQWETLSRQSTAQTFEVVLGNAAKIGHYWLPIQFELETIPPKRIIVYRDVHVGPQGLELNVTTKLLDSGDLRVQLEITNQSQHEQSYDCLLFPPANRQYQRRFVKIAPGETIRRDIYWADGRELIGQPMLLRAVEHDGPRVLNYPIEVTR